MTYYALAKTNELEEGFKRSVKLPAMTLVICYQENSVFIFEDRCPHMDIPLSTGTLEKGMIRCRAHGIAFDLATGEGEGSWADTLDCLNQFTPIYRDYSVGVEIEDSDSD